MRSLPPAYVRLRVTRRLRVHDARKYERRVFVKRDEQENVRSLNFSE